MSRSELLQSLSKRGYLKIHGKLSSWTNEAWLLPRMVRITLDMLLRDEPCHDSMRKEMMKHGFDPDTGLELNDG